LRKGDLDAAKRALDAMRECISLLRENRHTVANRLFRAIIETLDLATYFESGSERSRNDLAKWYQDKVINHGRVREQIGQHHGSAAKVYKSKQYGWLSKFTHRTYKVLCNAYCLGTDDKIWFDLRLRKFKGYPTIPQAIAQYLVTLGSVIRLFVDNAYTCKCVPAVKLREILQGTAMVEIMAHHADKEKQSTETSSTETKAE